MAARTGQQAPRHGDAPTEAIEPLLLLLTASALARNADGFSLRGNTTLLGLP
ncbi:MAG: hypothetical protein ACOH1P_11430 [Lysobacter sp.]